MKFRKSLTIVLFWTIASLMGSLQLNGQTVYTTVTGTKYHLDDCRYLKNSKVKTDVSSALLNGYVACLVCKPPSKKSDTPTPKLPPPPKKISAQPEYKQRDANNSGISSVQCSGITKAGVRCKRMTKNQTGKCYQH